MRTMIAIIATLALVSGLPESEFDVPPADPAPEDPAPKQPATLVQAEETVDAHLLYNEAKTKLISLQSSRKFNGNACIKGAQEAIAMVIKEVKAAQAALNKMHNGSKCAGKKADLVSAAQSKVKRKERALALAKASYKSSKEAKVTVNAKFEDANSNCNTFLSSGPWQAQRKEVSKRNNAVTKAKTELKDAKKELVKMEDVRKIAQCNCKDRTERDTKTAFDNAKKLTPERKKTIIRESMLICLVKSRESGNASQQNTAGSACKSNGLESKYNSQLALTQTVLVKMLFYCNKHRGTGTRLNDKCGGFRLSSMGCGGTKACTGCNDDLAFSVLRTTTWNRYGTYSCPLGWTWPTQNQWNAAVKKSCTNTGKQGYSYYNKCGWSGYSYAGKSKTYFRFSDSKNNGCYQNVGSYLSKGGQPCSDYTTSSFAGIACVKTNSMPIRL